MSLKFHSQSPESPASLGQAAEDVIPGTSTTKPQTSLASPLDLEALEEAEEAQLLIDDPAMFERTQIDRHIERGRQMNEAV